MASMGGGMPRIPTSAGRVLRFGAIAAVSAYSLMNCLFTVEGGHRAIVFNRFAGIKETVSE